MVNNPHPDPWFKVLIVWAVGFIELLNNSFEWANENSASVMFWIGAIYGILNIIALVRREFLSGKKDVAK